MFIKTRDERETRERQTGFPLWILVLHTVSDTLETRLLCTLPLFTIYNSQFTIYNLQSTIYNAKESGILHNIMHYCVYFSDFSPYFLNHISNTPFSFSRLTRATLLFTFREIAKKMLLFNSHRLLCIFKHKNIKRDSFISR